MTPDWLVAEVRKARPDYVPFVPGSGQDFNAWMRRETEYLKQLYGPPKLGPVLPEHMQKKRESRRWFDAADALRELYAEAK